MWGENLRTQRLLHTANSSSLAAALRSCSAALRNGAVLPNELDEVVVAVPSDVVTGTVMEKERCPIVVATEIPVQQRDGIKRDGQTSPARRPSSTLRAPDSVNARGQAFFSGHHIKRFQPRPVP